MKKKSVPTAFGAVSQLHEQRPKNKLERPQFNRHLARQAARELKQTKLRRITLNFKMFALTAGMAIAASTMAGATATAPASSNHLVLKTGTASTLLIAREKEPGDDRGKDRRHDDKGKDGKNHKAFQNIAREREPGDDRGKDRRHDDKGKDGKNHKAFQTIAREREPGDDRGKDRRHDDKGKDGKNHKLVERVA